MRAVVIRRPGGPEVLELCDRPAPRYGPQDLLVRVRASALNRADLLQRRGRYPAPPGAPADVPGLEFAGEVAECGAAVREFRCGDRVMGVLGGGGHSELVALHERLCLRVPPGMSWPEAAAVPEAFLTAYDAMFEQAGLAAGEALLVHAAGSGVGTAAVQLAGVAGARAVAFSRTAEKRRRLCEIGAVEALDPDQAEPADAVLRATGGRGIDVVLDLVGAAAWGLNVAVLRECGRLVVVGLLGGARTEVDLSTLMRKRLTVMGSVLRSRPLEQKVALVQRFGARMLPLFAAGRIRPLVDRVLPLDAVADAHAAMERNENFGKIVLALDGRAGA